MRIAFSEINAGETSTLLPATHAAKIVATKGRRFGSFARKGTQITHPGSLHNAEMLVHCHGNGGAVRALNAKFGMREMRHAECETGPESIRSPNSEFRNQEVLILHVCSSGMVQSSSRPTELWLQTVLAFGDDHP